MSKLFFRWLRGELNGYYLNNIYGSLNSMTDDVREFLAGFKQMQFNEEMSSSVLFGIGKFASVFLPRKSSLERANSLFMTNSHVVDGHEYSERGLYDTAEERFKFEHTTQEEGLPDINTLANDELRSSLVGEEQAQGYIASSNTDVFDEHGRVNPSAILPSPPSGEAYSDFYGEQFLFLSEGETYVYSDLNPKLYLDIYKALQWIRYNGVSLSALLKVTSILCPQGLALIDSVTVAMDGVHYIVRYTYNEDTDVTNKQQRVFLLEYIIKMKFKQCELIQN